MPLTLVGSVASTDAAAKTTTASPPISLSTGRTPAASLTKGVGSEHLLLAEFHKPIRPGKPAGGLAVPKPRPTVPPTPVANVRPTGAWACIAFHESGGNPATDTGNGFYGAFQFTLGSWYAVGGTGNPAHASYGEQLLMAERLQARSGWGNWPVTSRQCGV